MQTVYMNENQQKINDVEQQKPTIYYAPVEAIKYLIYK